MRKHISRQDFAAQFGADQADLDKVADFGKSHGLKVVESSIARRSMVLSGTVHQMSNAFAVTLGKYQTAAETYRGREGAIHLPADLVDVVEGVFGLDNRRMARPLYKRTSSSVQTGPAQNAVPLTPPQVATLYDFPTPPNGTGQTIGLLEFGGGYQTSDIQAFYSGLRLPTPKLTAVGVDGATNSPGGDADVEVALDIDVSGSVAPGADIAVYFAPWTEQGWVDIVTTSVHDTANAPSVLSISWGWPENETIDGLTWSQQAIDAVSATFQEAAAMGVTVLAASGDHGSDCGIGDGHAHVLYPASDPWVTSCGGTIISNVSGVSFKEDTWQDNNGWATGGGVSTIFPPQNWQAWSNVPGSVNDGHRGRGVPDVAGNADSASGYNLIVGGSSTGAVGGTSAVAPLYAGLVVLMNASLGEPVGYLNYNLYTLAGPYVYRDIADNISNATNSAPGYAAGAGWDACTGLGRIDGNALMNALRDVGRQPGLVAFNDELFMAWKGIERDDRLFWSTFNGSSWAAQQNLPGVASSAGPSLAVYNGKVFAAWKGMHIAQGAAGTTDDQGIWWSSFNGSSWAAQQEIAGVGSSNGPSLAVFNNRLYAAWKGMFYDQGIWSSSFDGTTWAPQQEIPNVGTSNGPSLAVFNGRLSLTGRTGHPSSAFPVSAQVRTCLLRLSPAEAPRQGRGVFRAGPKIRNG
jgi:hypothetical protein